MKGQLEVHKGKVKAEEVEGGSREDFVGFH